MDLSTERQRLPGHVGGVPEVCFNTDGARLASIGGDQTVRVWDVTTGRTVWTSGDLPGPGQCVAFSPDGRWLITAEKGTPWVCLWDALSGERLSARWLDLADDVERTTVSAKFSPDGRYLAAARIGHGRDPDGITLWELKAGEPEGPRRGPVPKLVRSISGQFLSLAFAPDAPQVAFTDGLSREAFVWEIGGATEPKRIATNVWWDYQSSAFLPGGRHLLVLDAQRTVHMVEVATGAEAAAWSTRDAKDPRTPGGQANLCLSPDGRKLAVTSPSSVGVDIWDPTTGRLLHALPEEAGTVYWLHWHSDSQRLAVSRSDGDISVWNLKEVERIVAELGLNGKEDSPQSAAAPRR